MTQLIHLQPDHWQHIAEWLEGMDLFSLLCGGSHSLISVLKRTRFSHLSWNFGNEYCESSFKHTFSLLKAGSVAVTATYPFKWGISSSCAQAATCAAQQKIHFSTPVSVNLELLNWWTKHFEERKETNPILSFEVKIPQFEGIKRPCDPFLPPTLESLTLVMKMSHFDPGMLPSTLQNIRLTIFGATLTNFNTLCKRIMDDLPLLRVCKLTASSVRARMPVEMNPFILQLSPSIEDFSLECLSESVRSTSTNIIKGTPALHTLSISFLRDVPLKLVDMPNVTSFRCSMATSSLKGILENNTPALASKTLPVPQSEILPNLTSLTVYETDLGSSSLSWPHSLVKLQILECDVELEQARPYPTHFSYATLPPGLKFLKVSGSFKDDKNRLHLDENLTIGPAMTIGQIAKKIILGGEDSFSSSEEGDPQMMPASTKPERSGSDEDEESLINSGCATHDKAQKKRWQQVKNFLCDFSFTPESCNRQTLPCHNTLEVLILEGKYAPVLPDAIEYLPQSLKRFEATIGHPGDKTLPDDGSFFNPVMSSSSFDTLLSQLAHVERLKLGQTVQNLKALHNTSPSLVLNDAVASSFLEAFKTKNGFDIAKRLESGAWQLPSWRLADRLPGSLTSLSIQGKRVITRSEVIDSSANRPTTTVSSALHDSNAPPSPTAMDVEDATREVNSDVLTFGEPSSALQAALKSNFEIAYFDFSLFATAKPYAPLAKQLVQLHVDRLSAGETYALSRIALNFSALRSLRVTRSSPFVGFHRKLIPPHLEELVWEAGPLLRLTHPSKKLSQKELLALDDEEEEMNMAVSTNLKRLVCSFEHLAVEEDFLLISDNFPSLAQLRLLPYARDLFLDVDFSKHSPIEKKDRCSEKESNARERHLILPQRLHAAISKSDFLNKKDSELKTNDSPSKDGLVVDYSLADPALTPPSIQFTGQLWEDEDLDPDRPNVITLETIARHLKRISPIEVDFVSFKIAESTRWEVPEGVDTVDLCNWSLKDPKKDHQLQEDEIESDDSSRGIFPLPVSSWSSDPLTDLESSLGIEEMVKMPRHVFMMPSTLTHLSFRAPFGVLDDLWERLPPALRVLHIFGRPSLHCFDQDHIIDWHQMPQTLEDFYVPGLVLFTAIRQFSVPASIPRALWRIVVGHKPGLVPRVNFDDAPSSLLFLRIGHAVLLERR